jgi:hypothetical protein
MVVLSKFKRYSHSSCIKGVLVERDRTMMESSADRNSSWFTIKTASYDQRFKTWGINIKNHYHNQRSFKKQEVKFDKEESKA